ncbi:cytochrome C biogenesis protein [Flavobacterium rivuli WB 3.3-2 = DSM 21788]|uniref:Cytochrome C biogenesis protein n=1 Tax=Flavobacterium rivuli WB 3.3-2 = DSM 21788 TaxID=1121895 RepID=A0A0A2M5T0_9FLAO|nr:cytochrome c biogenesis protein CcsA [Flavobacterium rivuli]KGO86798.1 cytochrome C biogenesis protein [Flavobacterium rivuli WB 3.3-2 = DSM 21788]
MDKIISFFSSTRLMAILFLVFAASMGIGTFIEDAYNTETARVFIYNAKWFEAIMLLFVINFIGNIKRYQLNKKEKWATLLLHLSFIFIIIGAFVTRYISFEGMMPIRENATESRFYSDKPYLTVMVDGEYQGSMQRRTFEQPLLFTSKEVPFIASNYFSISNEFNNIPFEIEYKKFTLGAKEVITQDPNGTQYLKLVEQGAGVRHDHYLKEGEVQSINNILFAFNKQTQGAVNIIKKGEDYTVQTPFSGNFMRMIDKFQGPVAKDSVQPLMFRSLYNLEGAMFVIPDHAIKGKVAYQSNNDYKTKEDAALTVVVKSEGKEKEITLLGGRQKIGIPVSFKQGKLEYTIMYGSKTYELPFAIKLNDFIAEKYPGTENSYASFESKVTIIDKEKNHTEDVRIFMNNVLDYRGYRFFQASYDPDELGTRLSVSHDFWGTWISYLGYFLLYIGLMAILFDDKNTRFGDLKRKLDKVNAKKAALTIMLLMISLAGFSQEHVHTEGDGHVHTEGDGHKHEAAEVHNHTAATDQHAHERVKPTQAQLDSVINKYKVSDEHAAKFSRIVIQDFGGRMKPANTFASELLRKVSEKDTYNKLNADQALLSMSMLGEIWYDVPIIALKRGNDSIRKIAGLESKVKYAAMSDFFDNVGNYKLAPLLQDAYKEKEPNQFQKDFIDIDKKINLLNWAISGQILKVLPIPNDKGNKWVSYPEAAEGSIKGLDTIRNIVPFYFGALGKATQTKDYSTAESILDGLSKYQKKAGAAVMPSDDKINAELYYNKYDLFKKLYSWYAMAGIFMFLFTIIKLFNSRKTVRYGVTFFHGLIIVLFALHTLWLAVRWYVSGHAPWSNAYESVIYVGWATMFFGLAFGRKSQLTVASTALVAAIVLTVAHWNWTDPEIANLVPVLNSYWLMIHVAVIVGSYGPLTLGMILGLVALILMLFTNKNNKIKMDLTIKELTYINEMALTVGLVMLSIGNFLGGQWANESWGRYWGWDPKETWALVSIMVYAFVIHMRFVPSLRGTWIYNFFSVLAYASILMTYFGVNFYLTGLHSYASGELRTPMYFFYMALGVCILGGFALMQYRKHLKK